MTAQTPRGSRVSRRHTPRPPRHRRAGAFPDHPCRNVGGDEGGFSLNLKSEEQALDLIVRAIEKAGYRPGGDIAIAIDSAAADLGFHVTSSIHSVRIDGENRPGVAAELTEKLAAVGINLRGFSAAVIGTRFIIYIAWDTAAEAAEAISILRQA